MSDRAQCWVGAGMLALAVALIAGGPGLPTAAHGQSTGGEGRAGRFALVPGVRGTNANTQTVYILDETTEVLFTFEYDARKRKDNMELRSVADIRKYIRRALELRAKAEEKARADSS